MVRILRTILRLVGTALAAAALAVLAAWLVGRVATDRWFATQLLFWAPSPLVLGCAAVLLVLSWSAEWLGRARAQRARRLASGRAARLVALPVLVVGAGYMAVFEWRLPALLTRPDPPAHALRVLYWNASVPVGDLAPDLARWPVDLAIVANPPYGQRSEALAEATGLAPMVRTERFAILSRFPVGRWALASLGLEGREQVANGLWEALEAPRGSTDQGEALFFELDATEVLGRPILVWVVDLPSDQRLARWGMLRDAAARIAAWQGTVMRAMDDAAAAAPDRGPGFPAPDVVVGDFNTPRGSASLRLLTRGMTNAYDQGGAGYAATFPRDWPLWHIDQMFIGPGLRAARYDVAKPRSGRHWLQIADLVADR